MLLRAVWHVECADGVSEADIRATTLAELVVSFLPLYCEYGKACMGARF